MPAIRALSKASYDHDLAVTQLVIALSKRYGEQFVTERELRYEKAQDGVGQFGHLADAEFFIDSKKIAIEVELNKKGNHRLDKIIKSYMVDFDIDEVWHFCGNEQVKRQLLKHQSSCKFLKVFDLGEYVKVIVLF